MDPNLLLNDYLYLLNAATDPAPKLVEYLGDRNDLIGVREAIRRVRDNEAPDAVMSEIVTPDVTIEDDLAAIASERVRLAYPGSPEWDASLLADLANGDGSEPLAVLVSGAPLNELRRPTVAIVGTGACTEYGSDVAHGFASDLAGHVTVATSLLTGIAMHAQLGAISTKQPSLLIAHHGIDTVMSDSKRTLMQQVIANGGSVISPYPRWLGASPPRRDRCARILATITSATILVQARRNSSLAAVETAERLGLPRYGVPGSVKCSASYGVHDAIRRGQVKLVLSPYEVLFDLEAGEPGKPRI